VARPSSASSGRRLVLATLNLAKGQELAALLHGVPFDVVSLGDLRPDVVAPAETGTSYAENALLKARAAAVLTGDLALADDSGLEVDALDGGPGIHSARFGGPGLSDADRTRRLLGALEGVAPGRRTARFRCVIALVDPGGEERLAEGVVEGIIADAPRGTGGLGYDPVFTYPPLGRTFGQLSEVEKSRVSHRGRAVAAARRLLGG
jgi:XTP/dITP diphosphohydrolase